MTGVFHIAHAKLQFAMDKSLQAVEVNWTCHTSTSVFGLFTKCLWPKVLRPHNHSRYIPRFTNCWLRHFQPSKRFISTFLGGNSWSESVWRSPLPSSVVIWKGQNDKPKHDKAWEWRSPSIYFPGAISLWIRVSPPATIFNRSKWRFCRSVEPIGHKGKGHLAS